jgi:prepilin-type processing-associated H-X9-DG protein
VASVAVIGILIGLLLPAVQAAREAARRVQSMTNLKQIGLSIKNDESVHGTYPARANFDKQGKPLLSWRVHMLPYLEENALYKQFHLDEPWDSEHNKTLIPLMPKLYANPSGMVRPGMANYLAVCGKGLMFDGEKGRKPVDIRNGTSNTIMVVEADDDRAVIWTKPEDWQFDPEHPMAGLGRAHPGGFNAVLADGSVRLIAKSIDPKAFQAMLTIAGGETVQPE